MRHVRNDVIAIIRRNAFETTDRDWFLFETATTASWFAWAVARSAKNAGKHVRIPVDHVRLGIAAGGDKANVFGHRRVRRTCVLAVDYLVKIFGILDVSWFQFCISLKYIGVKQEYDKAGRKSLPTKVL